MFFERHPIDERARVSAGRAAAVWLGVTQLLLAGVIFFRLYVQGQPDEEIRDFRAVLAVSIFGFIALQLFMGGILPVPTRRGMLVGYAVLAGLVAGVCLIVYGIPALRDWPRTWLPALLGPAIVVGMYRLMAGLGKWRIERQIGDE